MRIISGSLKGKKIKYLKNLVTRPLKDTVKENIFNILQHSNKIKIDLNKSVVLDLYSGVGSFGFECISRGSKKVTFIEGFKPFIEVNEDEIKLINPITGLNNRIGEIPSTWRTNEYSIFAIATMIKIYKQYAVL